MSKLYVGLSTYRENTQGNLTLEDSIDMNNGGWATFCHLPFSLQDRTPFGSSTSPLVDVPVAFQSRAALKSALVYCQNVAAEYIDYVLALVSNVLPTNKKYSFVIRASQTYHDSPVVLTVIMTEDIKCDQYPHWNKPMFRIDILKNYKSPTLDYDVFVSRTVLEVLGDSEGNITDREVNITPVAEFHGRDDARSTPIAFAVTELIKECLFPKPAALESSGRLSYHKKMPICEHTFLGYMAPTQRDITAYITSVDISYKQDTIRILNAYCDYMTTCAMTQNELALGRFLSGELDVEITEEEDRLIILITMSYNRVDETSPRSILFKFSPYKASYTVDVRFVSLNENHSYIVSGDHTHKATTKLVAGMISQFI